MAKQNKTDYNSYERDGFDEPPAGPVGVHRGSRSAWSRILPYLITLLVAVLAGVVVWGSVTGEFAKMPIFGGSSRVVRSASRGGSSKAKPSGKDTSGKSDDGKASEDAKDTKKDTAKKTEQGTGTAGTGTSGQSGDSAAGSGAKQDAAQSQQPAPSVNKGTGVRVVNGTNINGYAAQKKAVLDAAGYTAVTAGNPVGSLPSQTVVWYQSDADKDTAQDVANTLGISAVQQINGISASIEVVLMQ